MEQKKSVSMGELVSVNKTLNWKTIIVTILLTSLVLIMTNTMYTVYFKSELPSDARVVSLQEVVIAYAPELKRIIFLDRKTGQVQFSLSDSVSMAIFALKSSEVITDYSASLTNKNQLPTTKK